MENGIERISQWSSHEISLLNHVEVFLNKPGIMKKAEQYLNALGDAIIRDLAQNKIPLPPETKREKFQLTRGENHKGFPYLSLDIPQMFTKTEMFTYRTLFWWGHYLGFALILKGKDLPRYTGNLIKEKNNSHLDNVYLAATPTPWEWSLTEQNYKKVSDASEEELKTIIETIEHIKLIRIYPMDAESFAELDWVTAGISTWKDLSKIAKA